MDITREQYDMLIDESLSLTRGLQTDGDTSTSLNRIREINSIIYKALDYRVKTTGTSLSSV